MQLRGTSSENALLQSIDEPAGRDSRSLHRVGKFSLALIEFTVFACLTRPVELSAAPSLLTMRRLTPFSLLGLLRESDLLEIPGTAPELLYVARARAAQCDVWW